jgi:hypothetical protein
LVCSMNAKSKTYLLAIEFQSLGVVTYRNLK